MHQPVREIMWDQDMLGADVTVYPIMPGFATKTRHLKMNYADYQAWQDGMSIQNAFPYLTDEEREFLMSGLDDADWKRLWGKDQ
jgi:hypothetical protein